MIESIPELARDAPLKSLVRSINDPQTGIFSTGCVMGIVDDDRGYRYSGYIEFALNSKAAVQDSQNYFPAFFHFDRELDWGAFFQAPSKGLKQPDNKGGIKPRFRRSINQRSPI